MKTLIDKLKIKYPELVTRMKVTRRGTDLNVEIDFANPKYKLWFMNENSISYIVGVNFLDCHFDSGDADLNQKRQWNLWTT